MTIRKEPKNKNKIFVDFSHFTLDFVLTMRIRRTQDDTVLDKKRDKSPAWTKGPETLWSNPSSTTWVRSLLGYKLVIFQEPSGSHKRRKTL